MDAFITASLMAIATGSAAGLRPYFTVCFLGLTKLLVPDAAPAMIADAVTLIPDQLTNYWVLGVTGLLGLCEFLVDKFQFLDSAWDAIQGILRPVFGALVGLQFGSEAGSTAAMIAGAALGGGSAALVSAGKSSLRAVVNLFPEPVSNFFTSLSEDAIVAVLLFCAILIPVVAGFLGVLLAAFAVFIFRRLRRRYKNAKLKAAEYREARARRSSDQGHTPSAGEILG